MAAINLRERDGLRGCPLDVYRPVLRLHGIDDAVYSVSNAQEEIELFTNAKSKKLISVPEGRHFLSASHLEVVDRALINLVNE